MDLNLFPKITVILRGFNYKQTRDIVNILSKSKINSVEIPLGQEDSKAIINKIIEEFGEEMVVGAGTVLKEEDLRDVINIGVKFALSPVMFTDKMIDICKAHNVISVPGAYSPTEIYTSYEKGADIIKVFPADIVTPKFFKGVKAPLKDLKLMAVGGVNEKN
ncbi:bifunctional 4-hydroxy-2-oxoglutarate aldolase/2-dehydro-3-deoxy-phosphogluconate aldolase, partial [Clostridium polynesiense]|uniref:bifunctional 4-hydroxy-2-oxoglutarate aldolase/2-dehydro-3-deoxy-phosphogluconate aldolase n=1 Tax=Clostridium polynesiense TaxID=1325933 RepID=UPI00058B9BC7